MKRLLSLILILSLVTSAYAQEVIADFSDKSVSVLNEELRKIQKNISNANDAIDAISDADEKAKVSSNDTTAGYLNGKLVAGTNITLTEGNDGGNETLTIASSLTTTTFANRQLFTSSGTFTAPAGVTQVYATIVGAGAGAGGGRAAGGGGGGGGGEAIIRFPITVTPTAEYAITVGAKGTGGAANADGTDGGYSQWVSSTYRALGGSKGAYLGTGGAGGAANVLTGSNNSGNSGGAGGNFYSLAGGSGGTSDAGGGAGGGGSFAGRGGAGGDVNVAGNNGTGYGSGGGGGGGSTPKAGGDGTDGVVLIEW